MSKHETFEDYKQDMLEQFANQPRKKPTSTSTTKSGKRFLLCSSPTVRQEWTIYDEDFEFDAKIYVSGDFGDTDIERAYMQEIVDLLNFAHKREDGVWE